MTMAATKSRIPLRTACAAWSAVRKSSSRRNGKIEPAESLMSLTALPPKAPVQKAMPGSTLVDSLVIPNVDERVVAAMAGACPAEQVEAVGVVETFSLASAISVADISVKAADVELIEVRLGRGMGGKSYVIITGEVAAVESSVRAAEAGEGLDGLIASSVVIPSPHMDMIRALM